MLNVVNYVFNFVSVGSNILVFFFFFKSFEKRTIGNVLRGRGLSV